MLKLDTFRDTTVFTGFSLFLLFSGCQVFPRDFTKKCKIPEIHRKSRKSAKLPENHENVTDRSDTTKMTLFDTFLTKNSDFRHHPLGLDRGFGHSCQQCPTVVSSCGVCGSFCQNGENPLGLDRGFRENGQKVSKPLFFMKITVF